jgi:hypothetical protein
MEMLFMSELALYNGMTPDQLMAAMGVQQEQEATGNRLPLLKTNYQEEDDDGNELKKGSFMITLPSGVVYGKEVTVRVFSDYMQYLDYDPEEQAVVNKTIIHRVGDEPIDEMGSIRCGKPTSKELRDADLDTKAKYKNITCFRYLYARATMSDAKTAVGDSVEVVDVPVLLRLKGASFLSFSQDVIEPCRNQRLKFMQVNSKLVNTRQKNGSVTYFVTGFEPDFSNIVDISTDDLQFMSMVLDTVNAENKQVIEKHNAALYGKQADADDSAVVSEVEGYLDADFQETA